MFAVRADTDPRKVNAVDELTNHMVEPVFAMYTRVLERPDPRVPPCVAWNVSLKAKRLLYQGDVFVCHVVDVASFIGRRSGNAEIVKLLRSGEAITGFGVVIGDEPLAFSHEFLTDVLLGFETIESTVEGMLEAAHRVIDRADGLRPAEAGNDNECRRLAELVDEDGFVSPARSWTELNRES